MTDFSLYRHAWISAPHFDRQLSDNECKELLKKGGWMVRNTFDFDQKDESDFWFVIKDSFGGMAEHSSNERKKIRRAFNRFRYEIVEKQLVENHGFEIVDRVYKSYEKRDRIMNRNVFNGLLASWDVENHDFWGAFDIETNEMIGFASVRIYDNSCFYDMVSVLPEYKHNTSYPFYGFFYKLNEYYLGEKKFRYVTDGSRSMTEHSNIQPFLMKNFKFRKAYCKLKIHYKWWFGIVVKILFPFRRFVTNKSVGAVLKMHGLQ